MCKKIFISFLIFTFFLFTSVFTERGMAMNVNKKAILVVAFGTTYESGQKILKNFHIMLKKEFPNIPIYQAYTSRIVRHILAKRGINIPSPEIALAKLMDEGYKEVYILSLHIIPGKEYHLLYSNARAFSLMENGIKKIKVSTPLISSYEDIKDVSNVVLKNLHLNKNEAFIFMGHGTEHPANAIYIALNAILNKKNPHVFMATVEGHPTIYDIIPRLKALKVKTVYLMPFMLVAGDHANNDMAGNKPDSWKSILTKEGFAVKPIIKGLGENEDIIKIYIQHLKNIMK